MIVINKTRFNHHESGNDFSGKIIFMRDTENVLHICGIHGKKSLPLCKINRQTFLCKPIRILNPAEVCSSCFYRFSKKAISLASYSLQNT
jgi:hypothetical protein